MKLHETETLWENDTGRKERMRVPGGWIYTEYRGVDVGIIDYSPRTAVFVPDPDLRPSRGAL